jgi:hypothetical protein
MNSGTQSPLGARNGYEKKRPTAFYSFTASRTDADSIFIPRSRKSWGLISAVPGVSRTPMALRSTPDDPERHRDDVANQKPFERSARYSLPAMQRAFGGDHQHPSNRRGDVAIETL